MVWEVDGRRGLVREDDNDDIDIDDDKGTGQL